MAMEDPFEGAIVDPWVDLDPSQKFWLVLTRTTGGDAIMRLVKTSEGAEYAIRASLLPFNIETLVSIKDIRAISIDVMTAWDKSEVMELVTGLLGEQ